jgi:hypothetical protein
VTKSAQNVPTLIGRGKSEENWRETRMTWRIFSFAAILTKNMTMMVQMTFLMPEPLFQKLINLDAVADLKRLAHT